MDDTDDLRRIKNQLNRIEEMLEVLLRTHNVPSEDWSMVRSAEPLTPEENQAIRERVAWFGKSFEL